MTSNSHFTLLKGGITFMLLDLKGNDANSSYVSHYVQIKHSIRDPASLIFSIQN